MDIEVFSKFPRLAEATAVNDEIYEWIAVFESILAAGDSYTMIELGAGYGRWSARADNAARDTRRDLQTRIIAVEAEPTHFQHLSKYLQENGVDLSRCKLINAPVTGQVETVHFTVGHADKWYGQSVVPSWARIRQWPEATITPMTSTTIPDLLADLDQVDLIDMDIQGSELECIKRSISLLSKKVKRLFISTHSDYIHRRVFSILRRAGWHNEVAFSQQRQHNTHFGPVMFGDGIQYWINEYRPRRLFGWLSNTRQR